MSPTFGLPNVSSSSFLLFWIGVLVSAVTAQDEAPQITGGLAEYVEGTKISLRELRLRPHAENSERSNRLFPSFPERLPGDGVPIFLRMNSEAISRLQSLRQIQKNEYETKGLEQLNADEIMALSCINRSEMRRFVYSQRAGWNYPIHEEPWMTILLPDAQESRSYARAMTAIGRASILRHQLDAAEEWIRFIIGMSYHVRETPFLINQLVACAEMNMALDTIEELVQHPKADNYYWDLTSIPRPFIHVNEAAQYEAVMWDHTVPELVQMDQFTTEAQWQDLAEKVFTNLAMLSDGKIAGWGTPGLENEWKEWVTLSRERLYRVAPELVGKMKAMSDTEIGLRYWWKREQAKQKISLAFSLEAPFANPRAESLARDYWESTKDESILREGLGFYWPLRFVPFYEVEQRICMLRVVESIRDWSANHEGQLPKSLDELDLPAPLDVVVNQPFE